MYAHTKKNKYKDRLEWLKIYIMYFVYDEIFSIYEVFFVIHLAA